MTTYTTRALAGAAYQTAAQAYFDQWVELAAWDRAQNAARSFAEQPEIAPHAEFLQSPPGNNFALMAQRHAALEAAGGLVKESRDGPHLPRDPGDEYITMPDNTLKHIYVSGD